MRRVVLEGDVMARLREGLLCRAQRARVLLALARGEGVGEVSGWRGLRVETGETTLQRARREVLAVSSLNGREAFRGPPSPSLGSLTFVVV